MAFPTVADVTESSFGTATTSHAVAMPATVNANDALICIFLNYDTFTVTTPTGWTQIRTRLNNGGADNHRVTVFAKVADGTEDGTTVDFVTSGAIEALAHVYRINAGTWKENVNGVEASTGAVGVATTSPDPDALTPSWGAKDTLWIAVAGIGNNADGLDMPANYTNRVWTDMNVVGNDLSLATARRSLNAASEDPGAWTLTPAEDWTAMTVAVEPSGGTNYDETGRTVSVTATIGSTDTASFGEAAGFSIAATVISADSAAFGDSPSLPITCFVEASDVHTPSSGSRGRGGIARHTY